MLIRDFDAMVAVQKAHQEAALSEIRRNHLVKAVRHELQADSGRERGPRRRWVSGYLEALTQQVSCSFSPVTC